MTPKMDSRLRKCRNFRRDLEKPTSDGRSMTFRFRRYTMDGVQPVRLSVRKQSEALYMRRARRALELAEMRSWADLMESDPAMRPLPFIIGLSEEGFAKSLSLPNSFIDKLVADVRRQPVVRPWHLSARARAGRFVQQWRERIGAAIAGREFGEY